MSVFSRRYQKSGFILALYLSFIYLPLLLGVLDLNKFIPNTSVNLIIFILFSTSFITTINYKIILAIKDDYSDFVIKYLFAGINILIMLLIYLLLPFEIQKNTFIFSLIFLGIPWIYYFRKIAKRHCSYLKVYKTSNGKK